MVPDPDALARLLCDYCLEVEAGQQILLQTTTLAAPLVAAWQRAMLERDAWPLLRLELPEQEAQLVTHGRDRHLDSFPSADRAIVERLDGLLLVLAIGNTRALGSAPPDRLARRARGRAALTSGIELAKFTGTLWPTAASAQDAGLGTAEFSAFVNAALLLDQADPARAWRDLAAGGQRLAERLRDVREIRLEADGTDVTLGVAGRTWVNSDGRRNMPSGEVFTGPHERSASGTVRFGIPGTPFPETGAGADVEGVELTFRDGEVVAARADRGQALLEQALAVDAGARFLGEIGIGTNFAITRSIAHPLFDEKIGGTVHLALGSSYPETGGENKSDLHWDLICDLRGGGRLSADGAAIVENGRFTF